MYNDFILIGNDVVDLVQKQPALHPRYFERVLASEEQEIVALDQGRLAEFWAVKEAGFKAFSRFRQNIFFSPSRFVYSPDLQIVMYGDDSLPVEINKSKDYVYAVCKGQLGESLGFGSLHTWISEWDEQRGSASVCVRELLLDQVALLTGNSRDLMSITNNSGRIERFVPSLQLVSPDGDPQSVFPISFSHDGRFLLASVILW